MKILITGASGFIGRVLCEKLINKHIITGTYKSNKNGIPKWVRPYQINLANKNNCDKLIKDTIPDIIYHLAYDRYDIFNSIVLSTKNLVHSVTKFSPETKLVYLSTDSVFSGNNPPYNENSVPNPINDYGKAKLHAEKIIQTIDGMIIRTALVYGIKKEDHNLKNLLKGLKTGDFPFPYFTNEIRSPIYIKDLTDSIIKLENLYDKIKLIHLCGSKPLSRYELAVKIAEKLSYSSENIPKAIQKSPEKRPLNLTFESIFTNEYGIELKNIDDIKA